MFRIGINGYGRIGRSVLRALNERQAEGNDQDLQIVAINEPADAETIAHLTEFDSTHGRFRGQVALYDKTLLINNQPITLSHHKKIELLHWQDINLVMECTGRFASRYQAETHITHGADKVLFSHPAHADVDRTVIYGVNHQAIEPSDRILSNASCTTNGSVPVLKLIDEIYGIAAASITTLHSAMNDQPVIDAYHHTDLRKTRSASQSMIPVDTELAKGISRFLPHLDGLISSQAVRIPTVNVSAMDISIQLNTQASVAEINQQLHSYAECNSRTLACNTQPLASIDFNHDAHSCIIDLTQTRLSGSHLLKLFIWFDNEWGYANRMLDVAAYLNTFNSTNP